MTLGPEKLSDSRGRNGRQSALLNRAPSRDLLPGPDWITIILWTLLAIAIIGGSAILWVLTQ